MSDQYDVKQILNSISEDVVFLDVEEKSSLGTILNNIETLQRWARENNRPKIDQALQNLVPVVERLILDESENCDTDIALISKTVSDLQKIIENNYSEEEVEFSEGLGVSESEKEEVLPVDSDILSEFVTKFKIDIDEFEELIIQFEKERNQEFISELKRKLHNLKGEAAILGEKELSDLSHKTEDWLAESHDIDPDILFEVIDWLKNKQKAMEGEEIKLSDYQKIFQPGESDKPAQEEKKSEMKIVTDHLPVNADEDIFKDFLANQVTVMEDLESLIMKLDSGDKHHALSEIKRILHTIKGEANLMGLNLVSEVCHETETFIAKPEVGSDFLFLLKDWMTDTYAYYSGKAESLPDNEAIFQLLNMKTNEPAPEPRMEEKGTGDLVLEAIDDPELVSDFISEAEEHLEMATNEMLAFEESEDVEKINGIFRAFHTIKGVAGFLNINDIRILSHKTEDLLDKIRKQKIQINDNITDVIYRGIDKLKELIQILAQYAQSGVKPPPDPNLGILIADIEKISPDTDKEPIRKDRVTMDTKPPVKVEARPSVPLAEVPATLRQQERTILQKGVKIKENIKVDAQRLDHLIDFIGELAIAESMLTQSPELRNHASADLLKSMNRLDKITREVQSTSMSLRMVTVRSTFQKMARLVRDLAKKSNKKVDFKMMGEDTELDKNVVEQIGDPLVHLIRNSVDHGIEPNVQMRLDAGKPATGLIQLSAYHKGGNIYIEINDDGRGLDREAIINKAIEKEIISPGSKLKDEEVWNLIFEPGFSTAVKVTDVSGRGVGMDVVKKNIEAMRGYVKIESVAGQGTTFTIILPLTLAIIDGMVIKIGPERYIIPTLSVITSIRPEKEDYFTAVGKGEMIKFQDSLVPLFRLSEYFNIPGTSKNIENGIVVIVETGMKKLGIVVDHLLGQQQIVIKSLKGNMKDIKGISGGAIMPDGTVALILDIGGILEVSTIKNFAEE
ncbi:MAG: Hpt domain-containing protein [Candidatus Marinimicrobia bacterium]|nr:Hpt domain-containing protein [Candidatus Neomarinimicrobiota bacterium]